MRLDQSPSPRTRKEKRKRENHLNKQAFMNADKQESIEADRNFMTKLFPSNSPSRLLKSEDKKTKLRIQNYLYRPLVPSKQIIPENRLLLQSELKRNKLKPHNILYRPTLKRKVNPNKQLLKKELRKSKFTSNNFLYVPHKSPKNKTQKPKGTRIP